MGTLISFIKMRKEEGGELKLGREITLEQRYIVNSNNEGVVYFYNTLSIRLIVLNLLLFLHFC